MPVIGDRQLGATLVQDGKPLGFYTQKLNSDQLNYTVGEKELLGIIEGFKAFEGMIGGQELTVHTDHLNLLYQKHAVSTYGSMGAYAQRVASNN